MYPTKEEILANPPKNIKKDILILEEWKEEFYKGWKEKTTEEKHKALYELIKRLSQLHKKPCLITNKDNENYYEPENTRINISNDKPSIVSSLHEFGHHLYGESELKACCYSIWMYKIAFPQMYKKMKFEGHELKHDTTTDKNS